MKIAKRAQQKNIIINKDFYTAQQVKRMLEAEEIFFWDPTFVSHSFENWRKLDCVPELRVFTADLKEIKVVLEDGFYQTVAVGKNGITYYVSI